MLLPKIQASMVVGLSLDKGVIPQPSKRDKEEAGRNQETLKGEEKRTNERSKGAIQEVINRFFNFPTKK